MSDWCEFCEARDVCPRCGGFNTIHVAQENDYGTTTTCDRCSNKVYRTKPYRGGRPS